MGAGMDGRDARPNDAVESVDPGSLAGATSGVRGAAIATDSIKEKLLNLEQHMPDQQDLTYKFGKLLAGRLNPELVPEGFNMAAELLLYDLQKGVDGFSGKPIQSSLVGYPPMIYSLIRMSIPDIAAATCPPDFAKGVADMQEAVNKEARKQ